MANQQLQQLRSSLKEIQQRQKEAEQQKREIISRQQEQETQTALRTSKDPLTARLNRQQVQEQAQRDIAQIDVYEQSLKESKTSVETELKEAERKYNIYKQKRFYNRISDSQTTQTQIPSRFNPVYVNGELTGYYDVVEQKSIPAANIQSYLTKQNAGVIIPASSAFFVAKEKIMPKFVAPPVVEKSKPINSLTRQTMRISQVHNIKESSPTIINYEYPYSTKYKPSTVQTVTLPKKFLGLEVDPRFTEAKWYEKPQVGVALGFDKLARINYETAPLKPDVNKQIDVFTGKPVTKEMAISRTSTILNVGSYFIPAFGEVRFFGTDWPAYAGRVYNTKGKNNAQSLWNYTKLDSSRTKSGIPFETIGMGLGTIGFGSQVYKGIFAPRYKIVKTGVRDLITGKEITQEVPANWAARRIYKKEVAFSKANPPTSELIPTQTRIGEMFYRAGKNKIIVTQTGKYEVIQSIPVPKESTFMKLFKPVSRWNKVTRTYPQEFYSNPTNTFGQNPNMISGVIKLGKKGSIKASGVKRLYSGFVTADRYNPETPSSILIKEEVFGKVTGKKFIGTTITKATADSGMNIEMGIKDIRPQKLSLIDLDSLSKKPITGFLKSDKGFVKIKNVTPSILSQTEIEKLSYTKLSSGSLKINVGNENFLYGLSSQKGKFGISFFTGKKPSIIEIIDIKDKGFLELGRGKGSNTPFNFESQVTQPPKTYIIPKGKTGNLNWNTVTKKFGSVQIPASETAPTYVGGLNKGGSIYYGTGQYELSDLSGIYPKGIIGTESFIKGYTPISYSPKVVTTVLSPTAGLNIIKSRNQLKTISPIRNEFKTFQINFNKSNAVLKTNELLKTNQVLKTSSALKTQQIITPITTQTQKQSLRTSTIQVPRTIIPIVPIPEKMGNVFTTKSSGTISGSKAYQTFIKRYGKWKALSGFYSRGKAIKIGESYALGTLGASFKIVPTKRTIYETGYNYTPSSNVFRSYKVRRGRRIPLSDEWIQLATKRLSSFGERREIKSARRRKLNKFRRLRL